MPGEGSGPAPGRSAAAGGPFSGGCFRHRL